MKNLLTKEQLQTFEEDIAQIFDTGVIKAPVHSDNGNEEQLLQIFKEITEEDYICGTWRMHFKCLLKGVPPEQLKKDILDGKSITLCYKDYKIFSSAIVGGIISIALGIAHDLKRKKSTQKVFCFLGDMGSMTGAFHEASTYADNFELPIIWVVEDNNKSVCTDTRKTWNHLGNHPLGPWPDDEYKKGDVFSAGKRYRYYEYTSKWPHAGFGKRVQF